MVVVDSSSEVVVVVVDGSCCLPAVCPCGDDRRRTFADGGLVDNLALTGPVVGPVVAVDAATEQLASPSRLVRSTASEVAANLVQVVVVAVLAIGAILLVAQFAIRVLAAPVDLVLNLAER